jgi:hypothetical protein
MSTKVKLLTASMLAAATAPVPTRVRDHEYRRPGGHRSAKAAAKADRRRKIEKQTRRAQRRKR